MKSIFENGEPIPKKYTCEAENVSPPFTISDIPEGTKSLALTMEYLDVPEEFQKKLNIKNWDQWVHFNIPSGTLEIPEGSTLE